MTDALGAFWRDLNDELANDPEYARLHREAEDELGLAYLVPVDHIIAATAAGALTVTTAIGLFIWRAFIKPPRPRRTP